LGKYGQWPSPEISADGSSATVAWYGNYKGYTVVRASTWSGASWSRQATLSSLDRLADDVRVAISGDGRKTTVVWSDWGAGIQAVTRQGGAWGKRFALTPAAGIKLDVTQNPYRVGTPALAMSADGSTTLVAWPRSWNTKAGKHFFGNTEIQYTVSRGAGWATAKQLDRPVRTKGANSNGNGGGLSISISTNGSKASANWSTARAGMRGAIWSGDSWSDPSVLPLPITGSWPVVAIADNGSEVAVFADPAKRVYATNTSG
jgi:hypothetical protein